MAAETLTGAERAGTGPLIHEPGAPEPAEAQPTAEELASVRDTVLRLRAAYPAADPATVEAAVTAAYDSFRGARVRTYVPILAERRSRKALAAAFRAVPGPACHGEAEG
ncbi:three-helix bundle dimerization domain-containing protein [Streptomyces avidinii]|uniref:three-helix bundle dimerization domain-containing protein n=1 Tax=Streptomyces avidinii TaxID=1895 RepID=UPI0037B7BDC4